MVDFLESAYNELRESPSSAQADAPRILLIGPNMGYGDYRILELIKEAGGEIVIEELCEGVRNYWYNIDDTGDPFQSLTKGYLIDRVPCGFMRDSTGKRLEFALELVNDFKVDGIVWYELLCCETYDSESYYFAKKMAERNIPMLILESDYDTSDTGQIKTRLEAFMEIVKGGV
jgi:benzoyl-CoA reductase/2-hydroxyglutaryl-CoA dehydratase subunit BcrC/BadD/HgdB